jgi:hypothetical protein
MLHELECISREYLKHKTPYDNGFYGNPFYVCDVHDHRYLTGLVKGNHNPISTNCSKQYWYLAPYEDKWAYVKYFAENDGSFAFTCHPQHIVF